MESKSMERMKPAVTREKNAANYSTVAIILLLLKGELALRCDPSSLSPISVLPSCVKTLLRNQMIEAVSL
jgi:hypothetical protein